MNKTMAKRAVHTTVVSGNKSAGSKLPGTETTETQVIRYLAERMEVRQTEAFLDLLIETAATQTRENGEFTIPGLGKLVKAQRAARIGRNPATGEAIKIKAKTSVKSGWPSPRRMPCSRPQRSSGYA